MPRKNKYLKAFKKLLRKHECKRDFYNSFRLYIMNSLDGYNKKYCFVGLCKIFKWGIYRVGMNKQAKIPLSLYSRHGVDFWNRFFEEWKVICDAMEKREALCFYYTPKTNFWYKEFSKWNADNKNTEKQ